MSDEASNDSAAQKKRPVQHDHTAPSQNDSAASQVPGAASTSEPSAGRSAEGQGILVEAWFDVRCPWCFIGKGRLERGIKLFAADHPDIPVRVEHRSFELAPDIPDRFDGTEVDYLLKYEGAPREHSERLLPELQKIAESEGLALRFADLKLVNTHRAHQLFQWGRSQGLGEQLLERLFTAYFTECLDLADLGVLADLAAEVGLDRQGALAALDPRGGSEWGEQAYKEHIRGRMLGAEGVPYSLVNAKYRLSGAYSEEVWADALRELVRREFA